MTGRRSFRGVLVAFVVIPFLTLAAGSAASGSSPLAVPPAWIAEGTSGFGVGVASAGDVNNDGFSDVIVITSDGAVLLHLGSAAGPSTAADWSVSPGGFQYGPSAAGAGDVNGDGYADVIVGRGTNYGNGQVWAYLGSSAGLATLPGWTAQDTSSFFGYSVAAAGDVNGDGFDDVIVGDPFVTNGQVGEGRAVVYLGSASGLAVAPAWSAESDKEGVQFGWSVAGAGDVNGDGFADVIVGAPYYSHGEKYEGRAFVYLGSASGLSSSPAWTAEINGRGALFGSSVAAAGDVNGDGFGDVIVGAPVPEVENTISSGGGAVVYLGSHSGLSHKPGWSSGALQRDDRYGFSVASAGDVNGDGFADIVVGAFSSNVSRSVNDEGRAFLYLGSPSGPRRKPDWTAEGDRQEADLGWSVASAGDVDGDGADDLLVGAPDFGLVRMGRAFLFLGQCDEDEDGICAVEDNCPAVYNPGQDDADSDGEGDACDVTILQPGGGDLVSCLSGAQPQEITWNGSVFDLFRVLVSTDPAFRATRITSGDKLLAGASWTPPASRWAALCGKAASSLYIKVLGIDADVPAGRPGRKIASSAVTVNVQK